MIKKKSNKYVSFKPQKRKQFNIQYNTQINMFDIFQLPMVAAVKEKVFDVRICQ